MASQTRPHRDGEDEQLRSVAMQNAQSILLARQRAEEALEKKTAELAQSLAMMRATLDATSDGILAVDDAGRVSTYNEKFAEMWGLDSSVLAAGDNEQLLEAVAPKIGDYEAFRRRLQEIYGNAPAETYDLLELADGRAFERFSKAQLIGDRVVGRVWTFRDITDRRRAEEALARLYEAAEKSAEERKLLLERERAARTQAERTSELKDEFLATLSHELRTPLSAILGWSQVLRMRAMSQEELHQGLATIERNARAQTQLIEDLLDMSRITSGKVRLDIQPVDPITVIESALETVRPAAEARDVRLETMLDPRAGPVPGDPARLQQVVWNLVSNAIKFTPKEGKVQVSLQRVNSHVELKVSDTGIGIQPAFLPFVFERFRQADASSTRKYGGLGLGLSIVKHLVELHGGSVWAASQGEGRGSTFGVHLPILAVHESPRKEARVHPRTDSAVPVDFAPTDLAGVRVLLVDDEPDARDLLRRVLEECAADCRTAANANEALSVLRAWAADILITDIGMPDEDGYELLRRVRAQQTDGARLPAIALTAFARSEDRTRALRAGFLMHVSKPVDPTELVTAVASILGRTGPNLSL